MSESKLESENRDSSADNMLQVSIPKDKNKPIFTKKILSHKVYNKQCVQSVPFVKVAEYILEKEICSLWKCHYDDVHIISVNGWMNKIKIVYRMVRMIVCKERSYIMNPISFADS